MHSSASLKIRRQLMGWFRENLRIILSIEVLVLHDKFVMASDIDVRESETKDIPDESLKD